MLQSTSVPDDISDTRHSSASSAHGRSFRALLDLLGYTADFRWAFDNYKPVILEIAREYGLTRHLEIGGGRGPLFQPEELNPQGMSVVLNDISAHELSLAPSGLDKLQCDISAPGADKKIGVGSFDFAYCRMLMEHVSDVRQMWHNMYAILAPGGVAFSFFPTLYAPPFVVNRIMPEYITRAAIEALFPHRKPDGNNPKFPAIYDYCYSRDDILLPMLHGAGFSCVLIVPFYGYSYFWKFPLLKQIDGVFTDLARRNDWRMFSSFAYVMARKI